MSPTGSKIEDTSYPEPLEQVRPQRFLVFSILFDETFRSSDRSNKKPSGAPYRISQASWTITRTCFKKATHLPQLKVNGEVAYLLLGSVRSVVFNML